MAHFAEIDENNLVLRVLVTDSNDPNGDEGHKWLVDNFGGIWIKTSYNTINGVHVLDGIPLRGNYAGPGMKYYQEEDAFMPPKPHDSWIIDTSTYKWKPPVEYPNDGENYKWDEESVSWLLLPPA
jgi:hypothetical protein